jgi:hypothetical protein
MKTRLICASLFLSSLSATFAFATKLPTALQSTTQADPLMERSAKIVRGLGLNDPAKFDRVQQIIARQYRNLQAVHAESQSIAAPQSAMSPEADARLKALHRDYLARLAEELTPAQIDQVKDGMTYGVVPLTFRTYERMLPDLTAAQKEQILAWLIEAREHAMDAGTSKEKHAWFGKYKGKINNFLSAAGIDMKQAEKNLTSHPK